MLVEFSPAKPLSDTREANDFLRRVWACLRDDFNAGFQYTPWLDTQGQVQHIGFISLNVYSAILKKNNIGDPVSCSFSYKKRGIVDKLRFDIPNSWRACLNIQDVKDRILESLLKVSERRIRSSRCNVKVFSPLLLPIPSVHGKEFSLKSGTGEANLEFSVNAYDKVDLQDQAVNFAWDFCVLATAWSGHLFFLQDKRDTFGDYSSVIRLIHDGELNQSLNQLADQAFAAAADLLALNSSEIIPALKASHLIQRSIVAASSNRNLLGDTANTLAISALEVLSDEGADPMSCKTCGQPQYKISKRVRDFAADHLGGDHWRKRFADLYAVRSRFLHTGAIRHRTIFPGKANPTVQEWAPGEMTLPMEFAYDHVLTYLTLLMLKSYVQGVAQPNTKGE